MRTVVAWGKWRFPPEAQADLLQRIRLELHGVGPLNPAEAARRIKQICIRRCIDEVRRLVREQRLFIQDADAGLHDSAPADADDPVRLILLAERAHGVAALLEQVDETCRRALRLFYLESLSYREMGERLGIAVNTVGSRLAKCLAKLRDYVRVDPGWREYFGLAHDDHSGAPP
jgi:RNA polymerase sigma factor (sigma-70 family)